MDRSSADCDVIVVGNTVNACFLAARLASMGKRVALAASSTSVPGDVLLARSARDELRAQ